MVGQAAPDQWAAVACRLRGQLGRRQPEGAGDVRIERLALVMADQAAGEAEAEKRIAGVIPAPAVDADQGFGREFPGRFFPDFPDYRLDQRFVILDMTGRLIEQGTPVNVFFDKQIAVVACYDGSHRQVRIPAHAWFPSVANPAMTGLSPD